ncbi:MAG: FkbM family methyltransferase [Gloeotrichia echinulata IR180]|jgi:FkbM family methyltransferase|nr:FkbM family methyltransferase [Gloeotrichia echinulata DEX184]
MKNLIIRIIRSLLFRFIGSKNLEYLLIKFAQLAYIDILVLAYNQRGILKYWNEEVSGEHFVINSIIKKYFQKQEATVFDIGANSGKYAASLKSAFTNARIYAFEPNPHTFELLCNNLKDLNIKCYKLGLSSQISKQKIYTYANEDTSEHASLYKDVLLDLHRANDVIEMEFETTTLDEFCKMNQIQHINFIKIDTEGHELEVLIGASKMILYNQIDIIQFEFNEMNIISRVFLKDFYEILNNYNLYRLDSNRLIPLFSYESKNEIFQFQNFLAIRKEIENLNYNLE